MKKIVTILLIAFSLSVSAQDRSKKFSIFTYSDPVATASDGFNIGVGIDYRMDYMYFDAQVFVFPNLRGKTLQELSFTVLGFNIHDKWDEWRLFIGSKIGIIHRDSANHPTVGLEGGVEWVIPRTDLYIGIMGSYDYRTDGIVWEADAQNYWRESGFGKIGLRF
jgi:hypothetical protein